MLGNTAKWRLLPLGGREEWCNNANREKIIELLTIPFHRIFHTNRDVRCFLCLSVREAAIQCVKYGRHFTRFREIHLHSRKDEPCVVTRSGYWSWEGLRWTELILQMCRSAEQGQKWKEICIRGSRYFCLGALYCWHNMPSLACFTLPNFTHVVFSF